MTLEELIKSGRATISVEEASELWSVGRCTGYEIAEGTFGAVRCGRKLRVPVPRLLKALGISLPEGWRPAGACDERCPSCDSASDSGDLRIFDHGSAVDGRVDSAPLVHLDRAIRGNGQHARARCDGRLRSRDGTAPDE